MNLVVERKTYKEDEGGLSLPLRERKEPPYAQ